MATQIKRNATYIYIDIYADIYRFSDNSVPSGAPVTTRGSAV